jgi:hypothetical protein
MFILLQNNLNSGASYLVEQIERVSNALEMCLYILNKLSPEKVTLVSLEKFGDNKLLRGCSESMSGSRAVPGA